MLPGEFAAGERAQFRVAELYRYYPLLKRLRNIFLCVVTQTKIDRLNPSAAGCGLIRAAAMEMPEKNALLCRIRIWLALFIAGLVLSGVTAFPLQRETTALNHIFGVAPAVPASGEPALHTWLRRVHEGIATTNRAYPFMAYGTDWLAFAHLVIALAFIGPWRDPVRNKWVLQFGVLACAAVIPLALIAGAVRGIPLYWRMIYCSFGVVGAIPLLVSLRLVQRLEGAE